MLEFLKKTPIKVNKVEELEQKSEAIVSVFRDTLNSLINLNEDVDKEIDEKEEEITSIRLEINSLTIRQVKNKNFINKLNEFFE